MGIIEILILALGLSMDAFSVSICLGLQSVDVKGLKKYLIPALYFGFFQALMPLIGYFAGVRFQDLISNYDHWIAFVLLVFIGLNMIKEASKNQVCEKADFSFKNMLALAVATSIDALAIGVTFAFLKSKILIPVLIIGLITFIMSAIGVQTGGLFGSKYKSKAESAGGIILILIGLKILIEHTFYT